ncbi:MAG TPA: DUF3341 domain-containing protein [Steroidobacteraceae bacterium]|nr:DUF3341 domain-containing protein [Steroidobacteraceae bacterium]
MSGAAEYGSLAEFASVEALRAAVGGLRKRGYTRLEAYTPFPVEGLAQAIATSRDWTAVAMLIGGLVGGVGTLALQYYSAAINYPIDVGGRPDASWPAFIPAAAEMTILFAALAGVVSMLIGNGLPRLHHPLFELDRFSKASRDGLLLVVRADDPHYDGEAVRRDLSELDATHIETVPS